MKTSSVFKRQIPIDAVQEEKSGDDYSSERGMHECVAEEGDGIFKVRTRSMNRFSTTDAPRRDPTKMMHKGRGGNPNWELKIKNLVSCLGWSKNWTFWVLPVLRSKYLEEKLLQNNLRFKYELHTGF